ncbi:3'-5' exonuclease [Acinetobacter lanii]
MDAQIPVLPQPDAIRQFPMFQSLGTKQIVVIQNITQCQEIAEELSKAQILGFDTESKPTFSKGEVSTGPHLIQLATFDQAYLFQVSPNILEFLHPILANPAQIKVGFGLKNDAHLFRKKGIELNGIVDLAKSFSSFGIKTQMGVKSAVAVLFQQHFIKNKKISTSNWSKTKLNPEQILYAAADAYAPVLILEELLRRGITPNTSFKFPLKYPIRTNAIKEPTEA